MGAQRLLFSLFVLSIFSLVVVSSDASKCHDAVIQNLGVSPEEAKSLCAACMSVLPCNQCTSCFQAAKTLLAAAQCPINAVGTGGGHMMRRVLPEEDEDDQGDQGEESPDAVEDASPAPSPDAPEDGDSVVPIKEDGGVATNSIQIYIG